MHPFALLRRPAAVALLAGLTVLGSVLCPVGLRAAPPAVDSLINKLPDPDKLAKSPLETAIESQDPVFKDPAFLKFVASVNHHDPRAALASARVLTAKYPDKPAFQFVRGALALGLRQLPEAETSFRAVTSAKGSVAAYGWFGLAGVDAAQSRTADAVSALHQSLKLEPKFALAWMSLARVEARQGHDAEGADAARHVTILQPRFAPGWAVLGYCESNQKRYDAAIADYRQAIALAHNFAFAYEGMGICYTVSDRPADAVAPLKTALALAPRDYLAATELGYCYLRSGQYDDGIKACHQAVGVKPGYGKAWDVMGLCYRREGKQKEALAAFRQAVSKAPNDPAIRAHFAEASKGSATTSPVPPRR